MSKSQFIKNNKVCLSHRSREEVVKFEFSIGKPFKDITITMILESTDKKRHIEVEHQIMESALPCLIEWLQKNSPGRINEH